MELFSTVGRRDLGSPQRTVTSVPGSQCSRLRRAKESIDFAFWLKPTVCEIPARPPFLVTSSHWNVEYTLKGIFMNLPLLSTANNEDRITSVTSPSFQTSVTFLRFWLLIFSASAWRPMKS